MQNKATFKWVGWRHALLDCVVGDCDEGVKMTYIPTLATAHLTQLMLVAIVMLVKAFVHLGYLG
jgi:hypothetical protein